MSTAVKTGIVLLFYMSGCLLYAAPELNFYTDVFAWYPDSRILRISPGDGIYFQPCIHPAGTHVIYYGNAAGPPRVWKADLSTKEITALTPLETSARHPVFDWTGKIIAYSSDHGFDQEHERVEDMTASGEPPKGSKFNIYIMDADGANVKQITTGAFQDERPCISPDGKHIAFVSNRYGWKSGLWHVPVDGSEEPQPLLLRGWGYRPWYSADGKFIFFYTNIKRRHHICKIPAQGGRPIPLTNDIFTASHGPFSDPMGKSILVHAVKDTDWWGIWEIPLNGDPPQKLQPAGFENIHHGHATRARNGILTFDAFRSTKKPR